MKKVLVSMMTIALVSALIGGGIYAAFGDTETGQMGFQAGTIDLHVDDAQIWTDTIYFEDMKPGDEGELPEAEGSWTFKNFGTLPGVLKLSMGNLIEWDADHATDDDFEFRNQEGYNMTDEEFAHLIEVTEFKVDGYCYVDDLINEEELNADTNGDEKLSLHELYVWLGSEDNDLEWNLAGDTIDLSFKVVLHHYFLDNEGDPFFGLMHEYDVIAWGEVEKYRLGELPEVITIDDIWNVPQADGIKIDLIATLMQDDS